MTVQIDTSTRKNRFPRTRYQGSKRKLATAILHHLRDLSFTTVLDAFGGTGSVAYAFKCAGKQVTYNDILTCNHQIAVALIENDRVQLGEDEIEGVGAAQPGAVYGDFIERTFDGIYYTREENHWLDVAVHNIRAIPCRFKRAIAWFALFQAALVKRPYNLFHRKNLYMRTADVPRSFGNKATWDRSFADHFRVFAQEANGAVVDGSGTCSALCRDALEVEPGYDLVYIDTPYINNRGVGVNYRSFYHFLEGLLRYDDWPALVDLSSKHRRLLPQPDPWSDGKINREMFQRLFARFADSILVVSYRSDGIPPIEELEELLSGVKRNVRRITVDRYQYALSTRRSTREILLIGTD